MAIKKSEKQELLERLNDLLKKQSLFQQEINELQLEITQLKVKQPEVEPVVFQEDEKTFEPPNEIQKILLQRKAEKQNKPKEWSWNKSGFGSEIEKFIGENLINKIGIAVVIIGVGIGTKYAIDNDLISPLVRILLGYLLGFGLIFFALKTKKNYINFSAVLFSGAMAIHYFITYAAFTYYQLIPNVVAFILMVLITVLTVALALYYNRQIIAHYGLVGAYIVPFLLKDPDSSILVLLIYMLIINSGILFISTKKRWKPLNYLALIATWTIFISWFVSKNYDNQIDIALTFSSLFFLLFYAVFLSYKLILKEKFRIDDILFLLLNSGILYLLGVEAIDSVNEGEKFLGLFTAINALIHGLSAYLIYKSEPQNKNLFYWLIGIMIAFFTVAIPIQFEIQLTLILFAVEVALLFWIGRSKKIQIFDYFSFSLMVIIMMLLIANWFSVSYNFYPESIKDLYIPVLSLNFISSLVVLLSFSFIYYISKKFIPQGKNVKSWLEIYNVFFPLFFLVALFFTFYNEIDLFWNNIQIYTSYELNSDGIWFKIYEDLNFDVMTFKSIWLINYSLLFVSILSFINFKWIKNELFNGFILAFSSLLLLIFLTSGLNALEILRKSCLSTNLPANYDVNIFHLRIRYVMYMFFAFLLYSSKRFCISFYSKKIYNNAFEVVLSISVIWICSSQLIHWLSMAGTTEVYKHSLSILWGVMSFILIGYGIWKQKKYLRITAMVLFAGTLIKLFFYDLTNLETVQKTIVFLCIGVLLLVVSFLYNKYKHIISEEI